MNILALHSSSGLYGSSKVFLEAIQTLLEEGNSVTAIISEEGALSDELRKTGADVKIIRLGIIRRKYFSFFGILNRLYFLSRSFFALKQIIHSKQIDLVYSNTTAVLIGAFVAKATNKRHIWHIHEIIEKPFFLHQFIAWIISKYCYKAIAVSNAVKEHWQQENTKEKINVLYNGFDYSEFYQDQSSLRQELKIEDDCIVIGTIGRISKWKGQDYFLRIAGEINRRIDNVKFVIVGDTYPGNEYLIDSFKKIIKEEKIEDKVFLLGFRNDVNNVLHGLDVFVLPSILPDPLPTVVLEAMAVGKAVVATFQGGSIEMIEESRTGIFIPINDLQKAANLMEELILNSAQRKQMGILARKRVEENFSQKKFKEELIKIFV